MSAKPLCYRFLVGSSNIRKMITGSIGVRETHGDLFSKLIGTKGFAAENFAEKEFDDRIVLPKPFIVSEEFPFICATPDFIIEDHKGNLSVLEVKSGGDPKSAKANAFSLRSRTQVKVALEVLGLKKGLIYAVNRDDPFNDCKYAGEKHLKSDDFLFTNRQKIIEGYVRYLDNFFTQIHSIELSEEQKRELLEYIDSHVPKLPDRSKQQPSLEQLKERSDFWKKKRDGLVCHKAEE